MSIQFVSVAEEEGEDPIELPTEENGTILLSTVSAQFPGVLGLRYKHTYGTKATHFRGVRIADGILYPPLDEGWASKTFFCVFPNENKRKSDDDTEESQANKTKRLQVKLKCTDLIVLGLPYKTTEKELREYFENFGELLVVQIKKDASGQSKGYGFVRFSQYDAQLKVLSRRHLIDGRWCDVKIPSSKEGILQHLPSRIFVGRCTEDITEDDLRNYFGKFGEITDVYIPRPFRGFSFVTFLDPDLAQSLCGEDFIIKGVSVRVSNATPKSASNRERRRSNDQYNRYEARNNSDDTHQKYDSNTYQNNWTNQNRQQGSTSDMSNFGPLTNPAVIAAALNQAGWVFMGHKDQSNCNNQNYNTVNTQKHKTNNNLPENNTRNSWNYRQENYQKRNRFD